MKRTIIFHKDGKNGVYEEDDCESFFWDYSQRNAEKLREKYREGIKRNLREFRERMEIFIRGYGQHTGWKAKTSGSTNGQGPHGQEHVYFLKKE